MHTQVYSGHLSKTLQVLAANKGGHASIHRCMHMQALEVKEHAPTHSFSDKEVDTFTC